MNKVDLNKARMVLEELKEHKETLGMILEFSGYIASRIRTLSGTDEVAEQIHWQQQQLEEENYILEQLAGALSAALTIYANVEERIVCAYEEERVQYPEAVIGVNKVSIYEDLREISVIGLE